MAVILGLQALPNGWLGRSGHFEILDQERIRCLVDKRYPAHPLAGEVRMPGLEYRQFPPGRIRLATSHQRADLEESRVEISRRKAEGAVGCLDCRTPVMDEAVGGGQFSQIVKSVEVERT